MARKADASLKTENGVYLSQHKANENWAKDNPRKMIGFRVTPKADALIKEYVAKKADEENRKIAELSSEEQETFERKYSSDKGRPSVNALLKSLLEEEMQTNLDD